MELYRQVECSLPCESINGRPRRCILMLSLSSVWEIQCIHMIIDLMRTPYAFMFSILSHIGIEYTFKSNIRKPDWLLSLSLTLMHSLACSLARSFMFNELCVAQFMHFLSFSRSAPCNCVRWPEFDYLQYTCAFYTQYTVLLIHSLTHRHRRMHTHTHANTCDTRTIIILFDKKLSRLSSKRQC